MTNYNFTAEKRMTTIKINKCLNYINERKHNCSEEMKETLSNIGKELENFKYIRKPDCDITYEITPRQFVIKINKYINFLHEMKCDVCIAGKICPNEVDLLSDGEELLEKYKVFAGCYCKFKNR